MNIQNGLADSKIKKILFLLYLIDKNPLLTQEEMAAAVGVSETTIKNWLSAVNEWFDVKVERKGSDRKGSYCIDDWGVIDQTKLRVMYHGAESL